MALVPVEEDSSPSPSLPFAAFYCSLLPCLYYPLLPFPAFYCPLPPFAGFYCPFLPCSASYCTLQPVAALYCLLLPFTPLLPFAGLYCPLLPFVGFYSPFLPFSAFCCPLLPVTAFILPLLPLLPFTAFYCPLLPFTALYCLVLPFTALYCLLLPFTALYCRLLPFSALFCLVLPYHPLLPFTAFYCPLLPFSALCCPLPPVASLLMFQPYLKARWHRALAASLPADYVPGSARLQEMQPIPGHSTTYQVLKQGQGFDLVKKGAKIIVSAQGMLQQTGKTFWSTEEKKLFEFKVGDGSVIAGWDVGCAPLAQAAAVWFLLTLARLSMARSVRKTTGMAVAAGVLLLCGLTPAPKRGASCCRVGCQHDGSGGVCR
eukprot:s5067_g7.t1